MTFGFALYNLSRMNKLETFILVAEIDESQEYKKEFDGEGKIWCSSEPYWTSESRICSQFFFVIVNDIRIQCSRSWKKVQ